MEAKFIYKNSSNKPLEEFKNILNEAFDFLNALGDLSKVFEDKNGFNAFCLICYTTAYKMNANKALYDCYGQKNCEHLFMKFFSYFNSIRNELNFKNVVQLLNAENVTGIDDQKATIFCMLLYTINIYQTNSINFCIDFSSNDGLKSLLNILNDETFLEKNKLARVSFFGYDLDIIDYIVLNISALSKACDENKKTWIELDTINVLLKVIKLKDSSRNSAYNAIINIADDKQLEDLPEMSSVKMSIIVYLEKVVSDFELNKLARTKRQMNVKGETINCTVHSISKEDKTLLSTIGILRSLYKLTINEKMRYELFYENNLIKKLKVILSKGNFFEIFFALEVAAQLTFDKKISVDLLQDAELLQLMSKYDAQNLVEIKNEDEKKIFKNVKRLIEQINWNLNLKIANKESSNKIEHVMISYNTGSRALCLKIKENLEAFGLKVWIDVDEIHGSSLDAMAKAVEESFCVLMCVTEKYRQSVNCQAEAQYSFKLNKRIIPLIMQHGYESPQGWLGKYEIEIFFYF